MSSVKKEARLSGMLLARKGAAQPAHTDHRLTVHAVDPVPPAGSGQSVTRETGYPKQFEVEDLDNSSLVEAVREINDVTKRQYNSVTGEGLNADDEKQQPKEELIIRKAQAPEEKQVSVQKNAAPSNKRIAMTLRMEHDDHLKLRLYAAHSRKSCQEIISEALDLYLSKDEKVCGMSDCNCLAK